MKHTGAAFCLGCSLGGSLKVVLVDSKAAVVNLIILFVLLMISSSANYFHLEITKIPFTLRPSTPSA